MTGFQTNIAMMLKKIGIKKWGGQRAIPFFKMMLPYLAISL
jgi:hypothetical protein